MEEQIRRVQWASWSATLQPLMTDIPVAKAQLQGRITSDPFDGGRTAAWLAGLRDPTWRAVRCAHTGHTIHCVSDRPWAALTADLRLGLRILTWMSTRPIVWYWWDQEWVRKVPAYEDPGREHINGGWAVPGIREVHVYRREEAHKVLLHETVHALGLDVDASSVRPRFERDLGRRLWPHLGEAFTELDAAWLWSIAGARSLRDARERWAHQLRCSEQQAAVVWARIYDATGPEDTNVFAYYVLKWVLMRHLAEVLMDPDRSLRSWFGWWLGSKELLRRMMQQVMYTEGVPMRLGMTCNV